MLWLNSLKRPPVGSLGYILFIIIIIIEDICSIQPVATKITPCSSHHFKKNQIICRTVALQEVICSVYYKYFAQVERG